MQFKGSLSRTSFEMTENSEFIFYNARDYIARISNESEQAFVRLHLKCLLCFQFSKNILCFADLINGKRE